MDQLKGKIVNVVLTVQEGKGMDLIKLPTYIAANFNGRILESDPVEPEDDNPPFNTNLIWEIEKRELRKIRSSNQPLRVECLTCDEHNHRERFGHLLLDLRSAQIITDSNQQIPFKWQKLIGVRNKKRNCYPELYISLTIRNHKTEEDFNTPPEEMFYVEPRLDTSIPIKYLDDGYIVVGKQEEATENFSLNILLKSASNLDLLLPEVLVFNASKNKYSLCLKIFGVPINTKQFNKSLHEKIIFEERIVVRILSKHQILRDFFRDEKIEVGFYSGNDLLGLTIIPFTGLANINEKIMLGNCFFKFPSPNGIVPCIDTRKPSLSLEMFLMEVETSSEDNSCLINEEIEASGDRLEQGPLQLITTEQIKELEEWKETEKKQFYIKLEEIKSKQLTENETLYKSKLDEINSKLTDIENKKIELDKKMEQCSQLQQELNDRLDEINLAKELRKKRKSDTSLNEQLLENQKRFQDCDKDLLIDYITQLQKDNENLKEICAKQKHELENIERTALTKEQTANLLQELKGLEEKFEIAQQTKTYFKEQWKRACEEIHDLKTEDYRQLQDQLKERRAELSQLSLDEPLMYSEDSASLIPF